MATGSAGGTVVLVHGGFVDGSGWQGVYGHLKKDGYNVAVVQNPTLTLEGDVAATNMVIDAQGEPVILVGHSYGGAVITGEGTNPNVMALVYIAGFMPDAGESVYTLIAGFPTDGPQPILPPRDGFLFLDREKFHASFQVIWMTTRPRSWLPRKSHGAFRLWAARSASPPGEASQACTS